MLFLEMQELLMIISGGISCFFCFLAILVYLSSHNLQKKSHNKIIFYIALCEFFSAIGGLLGISQNNTFKCSLQSFLTNYFPLASIFWTTVIAYFLLGLLDLPHAHAHQKKILSKSWIHVVCWALPLLVSLLPLVTDNYGTFDGKDGWCFLRPGNHPKWTYKFWVFVAFFGWVYLAIFIYICLLSYVFLKLNKAHYPDPRLRNAALKSLRKLISYPLITLVSWSVIAVYIIWGSFNPSSPVLSNHVFISVTFSVPLFSGTLTSLAFFSFSYEARYTLIRLALFLPPDSDIGSTNDLKRNAVHQADLIGDIEGENDGLFSSFKFWESITKHFTLRIVPASPSIVA